MSFLRRLARRDACARRHAGDVRGAGGWHIVSLNRHADGAAATTSNAGPSAQHNTDSVVDLVKTPVSRRPATVWPREFVQEVLSEGLVEADGDALRLSSSGAAFLRRSGSDGPDAFAAQHQVRGGQTLADGTRVTVNECESPLGWLRNRKDRKTGKAMITTTQFDAGERLRHDFYKAQMSARVTADWSATQSGGRTRRTSGDDAVAVTDAALAAKSRFYGALESVGEELSDVLVWVCCDGRGLRDIEHAAGWPQRSGKLMLQMALKALARHYGLEPSGRAGRNRRSGISHWGDADFRPELGD